MVKNSGANVGRVLKLAIVSFFAGLGFVEVPVGLNARSNSSNIESPLFRFGKECVCMLTVMETHDSPQPNKAL